MMNTTGQVDIDRIKRTLKDHKYEFQEQIGAGGYGSVYLVRSEKYQELFVAKRIPAKSSQRIISEVEVLLNLHHPNIINMYEYWYDNDVLYIILEYCPHGSLRDVIKAHGPLNPTHLWQVCRDVTAAICFCHENNIVHRDIKPANLLVDKYNRVKLADFGLSTSGSALINAHLGSPAYMAPETFTGSSTIDHFKCDVWSLAVTMFELASGVLPWNYTCLQDLKQQIQLGLQRRPRSADYSFLRLLKDMMIVQPARRITIEDVMKSDYFTEHEKLSESAKRLGRSHDPKMLSSPQLTSNLSIGGASSHPLTASKIRLTDTRGVKGALSFAFSQRGSHGPMRLSRNITIVEPRVNGSCDGFLPYSPLFPRL